MKRSISLLLLCLLLVEISHARYQDSDITTFILVRHAEKADDGTTNPDLSPEGYDRADVLANMLNKTGIDAIYSTNLTRTMETVQGIAEEYDLEIQTYSGQSPDQAAAGLIEKNRGKVILVSGHSNTTPAFANALLGRDHFQGAFDESDYGNFLIITITGSGDSKLLHLRY